jgi:uncharacterized membrane protein
MADSSLTAHRSTRGRSLPTPTKAKQWEEVRPGTFDRIMSSVERDERHLRRMELLELGSRVLGQICGIGTVAVLGLLSKYFVDQNAPTQGAAIIVTGTVAIVTVFLTGRRLRR